MPSPPYQEGVGLQIADALTPQDIGNVPDPERPRNPQGYNGRLNGDSATNEGTIFYRTGPLPTDYITNNDIGTYDAATGQGRGIAGYFGVQSGTVKRWFGITTGESQKVLRNCVPLGAIGSRPFALTQDLPANDGSGRFMSRMAYQRVVFAAALTVKGGLQRTPIFHRGDKASGRKEPFLVTTSWNMLVDALRLVVAITNGDSGTFIQQAWSQCTISPDGSGGWQVDVYYFTPAPNDESDFADAPGSAGPDIEPEDDI